MIEIKDLCKTYTSSGGQVTALKNINLTVNDGEIFGIIGLSGAGKSTLVRCINFLEKPTSGQVIIDGKDLGSLSKRELLKTRQNIGMIFQGFNLLAQRNVIRNICYPLEIAGVKKADAVKRAEELLELVGLSDKGKAYPSQLSGGQKQRVAIARALAARTKYLLCDEATSALDPDTTRSILELMKKINTELGVTIVVITHEMKVIDSICDRVAVLDNSEVAETGTVEEVFSNPQSDIARKLILPESSSTEEITGGTKLRIVFNGESSFKPVIANMLFECKVPVNILHADTKDIDGKAYGQMILQLSGDDRGVRRVTEYLKTNGIEYTEI
ncbi:MAG: ATP-binding cassette domain-containing protein [Oscillospiraceae bacterium]|nr:ATP-binding cassette domain-containing protein [Oscillospiraceae bacterium]MDY2848308.1 ATP-binding cassette domain-containing protein [Oscillospiraceae bacterium]